MEQCRKMKKYFHKEKTDFLQAKGLCFSSHIVSVLEVSSLGCSDFLGLPLPCSQETNCRHYSCRGCRKLVPPSATIDADTGFLIQTNAPKAFEQWQVIASINEGPYTVKKKRLGGPSVDLSRKTPAAVQQVGWWMDSTALPLRNKVQKL